GLALPLVASAIAFAAQGAVPGGYQTQSSTTLGAGVSHDGLTSADPAQSVQVARVAPGAARLITASSSDAVAHQTAPESLSDLCRRVGCFAGISADFHDAGTGEPVGGVVSGGRMLRSPVPGRPQLNVTADGRLQVSPLDWSATLTTSDRRSLPIGGVNVDPRPGDVTLFTPAWGGDTPDGADTELVLRSSGAVGTLGATTPVEIVDVRSDPGPIPADGAVLAASGSASATLHQIADMAAAGTISRTLSLNIRTTLAVTESIGGSPTVLQGGHPAFPDVDDSLTRDRRPRSLVGWNPSGEVVLVTVDGGRADASGVTLAEAADLLSGLGATDGFAFDGDAATFVAGGDIANVPPAGAAPVNALMVVANRPVTPPPPPSTGGSGSKGTAAGTAPVKVTTAGSGGAPATGGLVPATPAPPTTAGPGNGPSAGEGPANPATRKARKPGNGKSAPKVKKARDGKDEAVTDPSIPDRHDINDAIPPHVAADGGPDEDVALAAAPAGHHHGSGRTARMLAELLAAGMIGSVLCGLQKARQDRRPRRIMWL
ncbi:MAG TPA: phosphodiester glycosidase family protein, partial [Acidimicrobiia bacterium]|nr:phosphodiester glycosidase family protein [Acidimicrobiia bacterium]